MVSEKIDYKEKSLLLLLIIIVSLIYSTLESLHQGQLSFHLNSFALNFLYSIGVLFLLRMFINFLDTRLPWTTGIQKRFSIQLFTTIIIYVLLQYIIIYIIEPANGGFVPDTPIVISTYLLGIGFLLLANAIYLLKYIKIAKKYDLSDLENQSTIPNEFMSGTYKGSRITIPINRITHFYLKNGLSIANTDKNENIIIQENLSEIEGLLDQNKFFRANRQHIITKDLIKDVKFLKNKTSSIILYPDLEIIVSRYKTPLLKKWLHS